MLIIYIATWFRFQAQTELGSELWDKYANITVTVHLNMDDSTAQVEWTH